jgi:uncharacterized protein (DUF433 family)
MATIAAEEDQVASPVSLRLPEPIAAKVRAIAAIEHRSLADTVRVLAEEAIKMREFPEIVFVDGPTGRRARFVQGPDVWEVLEPYLLSGRSSDVLRASYPELGEGLLQTAIRYYQSYPAEIDARVALNQGA